MFIFILLCLRYIVYDGGDECFHLCVGLGACHDDFGLNGCLMVVPSCEKVTST